jgi:hypothetical protein
METSMHGSLDRSGKDNSTDLKSGSRFLIVPTLLAIALIILAIYEPKASHWISEAVQAEFAGSVFTGETPAEPGMAAPLRTVRAY